MPVPSSAQGDRDAAAPEPSPSRRGGLHKLFGLSVAWLLLLLFHQSLTKPHRFVASPLDSYDPAPLVMQGGDPYIRALMRTISASEANYAQPYSILYGGEQVQDLSKHPDRCIPIVAGPNVGDCTTAAGRYQFLSTTWQEVSEQYHPQQSNWLFWGDYSFEPEYQDIVVYNWLADPAAWGEDLSAVLQEGDVDHVLWRLSGTWTSLGYGIETNVVSQYLPAIYEEVLQEELAIADAE